MWTLFLVCYVLRYSIILYEYNLYSLLFSVHNVQIDFGKNVNVHYASNDQLGFRLFQCIPSHQVLLVIITATANHCMSHVPNVGPLQCHQSSQTRPIVTSSAHSPHVTSGLVFLIVHQLGLDYSPALLLVNRISFTLDKTIQDRNTLYRHYYHLSIIFYY